MALIDSEGREHPWNTGFFIFWARIAKVPACKYLHYSGNISNSSLNLSNILTVLFIDEIIRG